ncbi:unnamed protein product [Closterium sp. NIES-64]|nr:unnamed protein product [Closterium sp. NIES-64]
MAPHSQFLQNLTPSLFAPFTISLFPLTSPSFLYEPPTNPPPSPQFFPLTPVGHSHQLTPHIAGVTEVSYRRMAEIIYQTVLQVRDEEVLTHVELVN